MAAPSASGALGDRESVRGFVRRAFVTGTAVTLPLVVTLIVIGVVVNFVSKQLNPVVDLISSAVGADPAPDAAIKLAALGALLVAVFLVGGIAESRSEASQLGALFEALIARVPGVGSLYRSLDEMSDLLLDSDTDSFREVKLVEFPVEGSYSVAFLTADTPEVVEDATGREGMVTLFLPMAPNPVMGGYVLHVSEDRVYDVEMSVEDGVRSIVTSGVATGAGSDDLPEDTLDRFERRLAAADVVGGAGFEDLGRYAADASSKIGETARETVPTGPIRPDDGDGGTAIGVETRASGDGSEGTDAAGDDGPAAGDAPGTDPGRESGDGGGGGEADPGPAAEDRDDAPDRTGDGPGREG